MDVNFAIRVEAWASALGYTVDSTGHVEARILRALRQIAGVPGYGGLMHFNNEVLVLLAQIAADGGGTGVQLGLLPASGVSAGSSYEVTTASDIEGPGLLQLKRVTNFPTSRTIAAADSEYGWAWINRSGVFTSADDDTTNDGESTWVCNTSNTDWFGGTRSAPYRYRSVALAAGQAIEIVCRLKSSADGNYEFAGVMILDLGTQTNWSRVLAGYADTNYLISANDTSGTPTEVSTNSTAVQTNGVWVKFVWTAAGWTAFYSTANQSTPPTSWTLLARKATTSGWGASTLAANQIGVGMTAQTVNGTGGYTVRWLYWRARVYDQQSGVTRFDWGTELFSTSGPEQLIGEVDFGSAIELDQTKLRQVLADAVNTRSFDDATVTFSVVGGSSSGPASSTYYAAGSVVVSGSYRYWRVYAKITSATGVEQGSIKLPLLLPPSVA